MMGYFPTRKFDIYTLCQDKQKQQTQGLMRFCCARINDRIVSRLMRKSISLFIMMIQLFHDNVFLCVHRHVLPSTHLKSL